MAAHELEERPLDGRLLGKPSLGKQQLIDRLVGRRGERARKWFTGAMEAWKQSRLGRTITWYNVRGGNQWAGGVAYSALFSLIAAFTIGYSALNVFLDSSSQLRIAILNEVERWLPGLIGSDSTTPLTPEDFIQPVLWNPASIVAMVVLLVSASGMMTAIRKAVRAMFRTAPIVDHPVRTKLASLAGFVLLAVGFMLAAVTSVGTQAIGHLIEGEPELLMLLRIITGLLGIPIDALVVAAMIRFVGGARPEGKQQLRDFWIASFATGFVATFLRWLGTTFVVLVAGRNMVFMAQFAAIITTLILVNFLARAVLLACAWLKNPPRLDMLAEMPEVGHDFFD